jgi:hypothetical protein
LEDFQNDWETVAATPAERFITPLAKDVIFRASAWDLPTKYALVVRVQNPDTYKITEKCFKRVSAATRFCSNKEAEGYLVTAYNNETLYSSVGFADEYDDEED